MRNMYSYKYSTRDLRHKCPSLWSQEDRSGHSSAVNSSAVMLRSCSSFLHRFSSRLKLQTSITDDQKQRLVSKDEDYVNKTLDICLI